jgi:hypothetical protein
MPGDRLHTTRPARRAKAAMFAALGRTCWICGHPGATDADLIVPRSIAPRQPVHPRAYRPAHGVRGCPTCGRKCNQERGARPSERVWTPRVQW